MEFSEELKQLISDKRKQVSKLEAKSKKKVSDLLAEVNTELVKWSNDAVNLFKVDMDHRYYFYYDEATRSSTVISNLHFDEVTKEVTVLEYTFINNAYDNKEHFSYMGDVHTWSYLEFVSVFNPNDYLTASEFVIFKTQCDLCVLEQQPIMTFDEIKNGIDCNSR